MSRPFLLPNLRETSSSSTTTTHIHLAPSRGWVSLHLGELWQYRELLYFLIWRDVKVRYKQTVLGAAWAVIQPFMTMVVFSLFFGNLANVPSDGVPYPLIDGRRTLRFHGLFVDQPHIQEGQVIQEKLDLIRVRVVPKPGFSAADEQDIVARVQQRLTSQVRVVVEAVPAIERTKAGKFRAVISNLSPEERARVENA